MPYFSNWVILFPIAFSLLVALRLSEGSCDHPRRTLTSTLLRSTILVAFLFSFLSIGLRAHWLSLVWGVMLTLFSLVLFWKNRRLDRSAMLLIFMNTQSHEQRTATAATFAEDNYGYVRRRGRDLYRDFTLGVPWDRALELRGVAKSVYEKLSVRLQSRYHPSPETERASNADLQNPLQIEQEVERMLGRTIIFSWIVLLIPVLALFMSFVVPTLQEMFEEFGLELPPVFLLVIAVGSDFSNLGWSALFALVPVMFLMLLTITLTLWLFPALTRLPVIRWIFRDYYRNLGFTALARVAELESDLLTACHATAALVPVEFIAQQYRLAASFLTAGASPSQAFSRAGLVSKRESAAIGFGLEAHNPAWGLRQLASWKTERMLRRYMVAMQFAIVIVTILLGIVVGALAVGVLQILTTMIHALSNSVL